MKKLILPLVALFLVPGCTVTSGEKYSNETRDVIQQTETNLNLKLTELEKAVNNQSDHIKNLESEVTRLNSQMTHPASASSSSGKQQVSPPPVQVSVSQTGSNADGLITLGAVETVKIVAADKQFNARIDTGTETSSLNALDVQAFEREGKKWVRFHISKPASSEKEKLWIEAPLIRYANIRQASVNSVEKRPVVELWVRLGEIHEKAEFTLTDRSKMSHPVLLGRGFVRDIALVDVRKTHLYSETQKKNQK